MKVSQKVVIPAQAGIQPQYNQLKTLDSRIHGNDPMRLLATFCETVNNETLNKNG